MFKAKSNRLYLVRANVPGIKGDIKEECAGGYLGTLISDIKEKYPDFKRIAVYEDETKEAVGFIKK